MHRLFSTLPLLLLLACGGPPPAADPVVGPTQLGLQDYAVATQERISTGPRVSGVLDAAQKATIRAEAAGTAEAVLVEVGQVVKRGDLLARIEATALRSNQVSAQSGVTAAQQDVLIAERELARVKRLVEVGALAARDQEQAESGLIAAQSRLSGARAQSAGANEQASGSVVRAPIAGVVSERSVSMGDVVAPGSPLFTVLEPSSLRLSGAVPAEAITSLRVDALVQIFVQGNPNHPFEGRVERIAPAVDPATRQIPVLISIPNPDGALVAGLFAEGEITAQATDGVVVPTDALLQGTGAVEVLVVRNGKVERTTVTTGLRNDRTERVELTSGVNAGEAVLVGPAREVEVGTEVKLATPAPAAPATPDSTASPAAPAAPVAEG